MLIGATLALDGKIPLGAAERAHRTALSVGLRVSGLVGSGLGGWSLTQGTKATDGPVLGLNGAFVALAVGIAGFPRRHRF